MSSKNSYDKPVGVVGAGSFGSAIANILAKNTDVILYARNPLAAKKISESRKLHGLELNTRITPTNDLKFVAENCDVIFPIIPSENFPALIDDLSPFLKPYHILIHGTKGLIVSKDNWEADEEMKIAKDDVFTMSRLIREKTLAVRIGCLAGPNLAKELADNQPAATVVASHFDEVISEGQRLLRNDRFQVYGSKDLLGIELTGVLKNIIAIAAGALSGMGYGENARAMLVSRGLIEMIYLGQMLGANTQAFLGLAGIGDLVATCSSKLSRNFTVGERLGKGENLADILNSLEETAEGINTIKIITRLVKGYQLRSPITESLYKVIHGDMTIEEALRFLMKAPFSIDIDFM
ncbi:MAG: NAD(P)H-dependent glycerol-3-phosphate dehydrogenase [Cyclobacteriaceae bacterium]|nr:NAD(P)H-dependent glycerol-3-phosphate dehydrogenase [Cyclobacteriaceae bacterium]MCK5279099.1 NAD(P)H-dependent glycerol-3-phosphate dehydrogenase [Cyclobacteriaceae bacterium]MCK5371863.1 NAD(P)H-dependent glycerol-3-phosphate dehydrogenase [Cyclobacteriaceae bacterium]MCK5703723.1 NAD(P)H-dependent glycerol-3-phosphate dehydrogenase [Cyclobacteriaceae bacterium]